MTRVRFAAPARRELLNEAACRNGKGPGLGARFAEAVGEAATRAPAYPLSGARASASTRRVFVEDFPFAIGYRADDEGIVIFAVAHHFRRPDYWRSRVEDH